MSEFEVGATIAHNLSGAEYIHMGQVPETGLSVLVSVATNVAYTLDSRELPMYYRLVPPKSELVRHAHYQTQGKGTFVVELIAGNPGTFRNRVAFGFVRSLGSPNWHPTHFPESHWGTLTALPTTHTTESP